MTKLTMIQTQGRSHGGKPTDGNTPAGYQEVDCISTHLQLGTCIELSAVAQFLKRQGWAAKTMQMILAILPVISSSWLYSSVEYARCVVQRRRAV